MALDLRLIGEQTRKDCVGVEIVSRKLPIRTFDRVIVEMLEKIPINPNQGTRRQRGRWQEEQK